MLNGASSPKMMWNPPWLLAFMMPVLFFDFAVSAQAWIFANICFLFLGAYLLNKAWNFSYLSFALLVSFFPPIWNCIDLGQIGCLLFLGVCLLISSLQSGKSWKAGLGLVILSCKPHLFFLVYILYLVEFIKKRQLATLAWAAFFFVLANIIILIINPLAFYYWLESLFIGKEDIYVKPVDWIGPFPLSAIRAIPMNETWLSIVRSLTFITPGVSAILVFYLGIKNRLSLSIDNNFSLIVFLSFTLSPFGWLFDQAALLPSVLYSVRNCKKKLVVYIGVFAIGLAHLSFGMKYLHEIFWFLPLCFLIFLLKSHKD